MTTSLSERCRHEFTDRDWGKGEAYFRRGAVSWRSLGPHGAIASVRGSSRQPYEVMLDWLDVESQTLQVFCSCPRFDDAGNCKHVAAAIMDFDAKGLGKSIPGERDLYFTIGDEEDLDALVASGTLVPVTGAGETAAGTGALNRAGWTGQGKSGRRKAPRQPPQENAWKAPLASLVNQQNARLFSLPTISYRARPEPTRQIWYLINLERTATDGETRIRLLQRPLKKNGEWGKFKSARLELDEVRTMPQEDRTLLELLFGSEPANCWGDGFYDSYHGMAEEFILAPAMNHVLLPRLAQSGRFGYLAKAMLQGPFDVQPLAWDAGPAWRFCLRLDKTKDRRHWQLSGHFERDGQTMELAVPQLVMGAGYLIANDALAQIELGEHDLPSISLLRKSGPLLTPLAQQDELIELLAQLPGLPIADLPEELRWEEERPEAVPHLRIHQKRDRWRDELECELSFEYGQGPVALGTGPPGWFDRQQRRMIRRDLGAEILARGQLLAAGALVGWQRSDQKTPTFRVTTVRMPALVQQLAALGWIIDAAGQRIRQAGEIKLSVTGGVDWFDLAGNCDFDGVSVGLPTLLKALKHGEQFVRLDDGSQGMLPTAWLDRYAGLLDFGTTEGDCLRYVPSQAMLLDALLAAQENERVAVDRSFDELRQRLRSFEGIEPRQEPATFAGTLRAYQREGLGWLRFLDEFGFGGCLADDMGLGKTVQILALLEERRLQGNEGQPPAKGKKKKTQKAAATRAPSLVVVPRSLVFNWKEEARRFTPELRVLDYTGLGRSAELENLNQYDLVVTTYGTLRRDVPQLRNLEFDYCILDEAQAIKNASSQAAKACRLLRARRRLAMTGTPVENHLGELWSLFEFLNPGMLGRREKLNGLLTGARRSNGAQDQGTAENLELLARALRPFLLRRTKGQVLSELPEKTEQTLYCELEGDQRKQYEELREHYRQSLLARVAQEGVNKSKIHVLEALLRLRQAACHPGLLDKKQVGQSSAKLETLLEQVGEVLAEGHKALVFSQFTSLLAIVRDRLNTRGIDHAYLDGQTLKRQAIVERFQTDPQCRLFLISLKAGGQGLNLTAADYVFILDPWWNPAVEAQAVDRAHRMGQQRHVFAYRLIARDTVEEKILQLQAHKRELADAIITADNSLLKSLTAEDLQLLLS